MPRGAHLSAITIAWLGAGGVALPALAQPGAQPAPPPGISAKEWEEIQKATGADAAARTPAPPGAAAAAETVPTAPPASGGGLQSMNPDIAFILDTAVAYFSDDEPLQTGA